MKLVQRLYDVDAGAIRIDGQDVRDMTQASLRQSIALVPQDPALFHRSLREPNWRAIMMMRRSCKTEAVRAAT